MIRPMFALVGAALAAGTVFGVPAPAKADGNDQAFLVALRQAGLSYEDPERAITAGKTVCNQVAGGMTGMEIVKSLQDVNPDFAGDGAAKFAAISAEVYCPKAIAGFS